ncbi:hypothetical protein X801_00852 [Opisthorchis viverrini]|nr:hypothetical protein X801_00852 [Opisthorchis viverrini]
MNFVRSDVRVLSLDEINDTPFQGRLLKVVLEYNRKGKLEYTYTFRMMNDEKVQQYMHCTASSLIKPGSSNREVNITGCWRCVTSKLALSQQICHHPPSMWMEYQQEEMTETASPTYPGSDEDSEEPDTDYRSRSLEVKNHQFGVNGWKEKRQLLKRMIKLLNRKASPFVEKLYLSGVPNLLIEH